MTRDSGRPLQQPGRAGPATDKIQVKCGNVRREMFRPSQRKAGKSWTRQETEYNPTFSDSEVHTAFPSNIATSISETVDGSASRYHVQYDPSAIQEMDMVSLRRELSRCYKALIALQSRTGMHEHLVELEGELVCWKAKLASAEETIEAKDSMIVDLAHAANEMSQCSQKQLTLMMSAQQKNSSKLRETVENLHHQLTNLEQLNQELALKIRSLTSLKHPHYSHQTEADEAMFEVRRSSEIPESAR